MRIAVQLEADGVGSNFFQQCFYRLVQQQPNVQVMFLFDGKADLNQFQHPNIQYVRAPKNIDRGLGKFYWRQFKLPSILKQNKIDCFCTSQPSIRLRRPIQRIVWMDNGLSVSRNIRKKDGHGNHIVVSSRYLYDDIARHIPASGNQLWLIPPGIETRKPMEPAVRESLKQQHTQGKDFFYFDYSRANKESLLIVLKAFSLFKKWQRSNVQLLISAHPEQLAYAEAFSAHYAFKTDLVFMKEQEASEMDMMGAAYACIGMPAAPLIDPNLLRALSYPLPLLVPSYAHFRSYFGDTVLYTEENEKDLSRLMIVLYKDEILRNHLLHKCQELKAQNTWEHASEALWNVINQEKKS